MLAAFFHLVSLKTARTLLTHTRNIGRNKKIVVDSFFPVGRSVELSIIINHIVVELSEFLNAASSPPQNRDIIVHHAIDISANNAVRIFIHCLGVGEWLKEVMVHAQVVAEFMSHDLF